MCREQAIVRNYGTFVFPTKLHKTTHQLAEQMNHQLHLQKMTTMINQSHTPTNITINLFPQQLTVNQHVSSSEY